MYGARRILLLCYGRGRKKKDPGKCANVRAPSWGPGRVGLVGQTGVYCGEREDSLGACYLMHVRSYGRKEDESLLESPG